MMAKRKKAVVLLSGGLDSATVLAIAGAEGFACHCLSFRYGQRHEFELIAAANVAKQLGAEKHVIAQIDLRVFGGSALTSDIAGPEGSRRSMRCRNMKSPSHTSRRATRSSCHSRWRGPRCSNQATFSLESMHWTTAATPIAGRSTSARMSRWPTWRPRPASKGSRSCKIHTPLIQMTKGQIIARGISNSVWIIR